MLTTSPSLPSLSCSTTELALDPLTLSATLIASTTAAVASAPSFPALLAAASLLSQPPSLSSDAPTMTLSQSSSMAAPVAFVPPVSSTMSPMTTSESLLAPPVSSSEVSVASDVDIDSVVPSSKSLRHKLRINDGRFANNRPLVVGHRGALYLDLENTRSGFDKCAEMGCDAVELDVFLLKCGALIVFHGGGTDENPGDLYDYCNRVGNILDLTYEEALQLKFNPENEEFPCPESAILAGSIPTLEQVLLDAKKTGLSIKIELKGEGTVEPTLEVVDRLNMVNQVSFSSFNLDRIALLRKLRPDMAPGSNKHIYQSGALFNGEPPKDFLDICSRIGADEIHLKYDCCTVDTIQRIHNAGFGSMAWFRGPVGMTSDTMDKYWDVGNEDESMYDLFRQTGVEQMCVNRPDVFIALLDKVEEMA